MATFRVNEQIADLGCEYPACTRPAECLFVAGTWRTDEGFDALVSKARPVCSDHADLLRADRWPERDTC